MIPAVRPVRTNYAHDEHLQDHPVYGVLPADERTLNRATGRGSGSGAEGYWFRSAQPWRLPHHPREAPPGRSSGSACRPCRGRTCQSQTGQVHLTVVHGTISSKLAYWTSGFAEFVDAIFLPFLVNYHEHYRPEIEEKHRQGRTSWPAPWQMSWALRNATSHSGKVFKTATQAPVSWRGLTFGPNDEPARKILSLVNGADILILLLEMEEARTGVPLVRA